jgi:hypothetical protein
MMAFVLKIKNKTFDQSSHRELIHMYINPIYHSIKKEKIINTSNGRKINILLNPGRTFNL